MNFMAFEYWTDGWRDGSLMPNDEGLRRCKCGEYVLVKDMIAVDKANTSESPYMDHVPDDLLPGCIAKAASEELEVAARFGYWRHLNHPYRERYRQHRDAEEAATKSVWEKASPDSRTWWDKLRGRQSPSYSRSPGSPFTYPVFEASGEQIQNMQRLSKILQEWSTLSRQGYTMELAELYREQGRFDESEQVILILDDREVGITSNLTTRLIKEKQTAPMRYMMLPNREINSWHQLLKPK
jgi:hypothetical protein